MKLTNLKTLNYFVFLFILCYSLSYSQSINKLNIYSNSKLLEIKKNDSKKI